MLYTVTAELSIPERANERHQDLSITEVRRAEKANYGYGRVIGGDKADLLFNGYDLFTDRTVLYKPAIVTHLEGLTEDEVNEIAAEVLAFSYDSIGAETVQ